MTKQAFRLEEGLSIKHNQTLYRVVCNNCEAHGAFMSDPELAYKIMHEHICRKSKWISKFQGFGFRGA